MTICVSAGIALHSSHRTVASSAPSGSATAPTTLSSPTESQSSEPAIYSAAAEPYPNPDAAATAEELLVLARRVVARSPQCAIAWAQSQADSLLRRRLLSAVIRAWGENDPSVAVDWVLMQDDSERQADMDAALAGAVTQPQLALAIVRGLLKYDPNDGACAAAASIVALNNAGRFQTALEFINDGPTNFRADWTKATFQHWGGSRPQDAILALDSMADAQLRNDAFHALADGWSASDPSALADYATSLPTGPNQTYALDKAIDHWSLQDPATLANWLNTSPQGVDFDQAIATLISKIDSVNGRAEIVMQWVERISALNPRYDSMLRVLEQWNQTAPAAAQNYAANVSWLDEPGRQELVKHLQSPPPNVAASSNE